MLMSLNYIPKHGKFYVIYILQQSNKEKQGFPEDSLTPAGPSLSVHAELQGLPTPCL